MIALGTWHVQATHSGWDLGFGPTPQEHYIHHNVNVNYNLGIFFDSVFGTYMSPKECKPEYFVFDRFSTGKELKEEANEELKPKQDVKANTD